MIEVRRDDGEPCRYVDEQSGGWRSLTIFGGALDELVTGRLRLIRGA